MERRASAGEPIRLLLYEVVDCLGESGLEVEELGPGRGDRDDDHLCRELLLTPATQFGDWSSVLVVIPSCAELLGLEPMEPTHWALVVTIALAYLIAPVELGKWITARRSP